MKISSIHIENFRSFKDETITFSDYTCLVGANGSGKSNVICALNVVFGETEGVSTDLRTLTVEDFHNKDTKNPIVITVIFTDLSEAAKDDFADYFRQEALILSAVAEFDQNTGTAVVKQFGQRKGMDEFKEYFKAKGDKKTTGELKPIFANIKTNFSDLPNATTEPAMTAALRDYESNHPELCVLIPSEDQFYGISKGKNLLAKYLQWVYIPAVKDVIVEQREAKSTALGKLLARTVRARVSFGDKIKEIRETAQRDYQILIDSNQSVLDEISGALQKRLTEWSHPDAALKLLWSKDDKAIKVDEPFAQILAGEGAFEGDLARFGHGFQRSYFLALLQVLSASGDDPSAPKLILACEEPELFQHPPQARHLYNVFQNLIAEYSQVIICTHSPYFVSGDKFEDIRIVRKCSSVSNVKRVTYDQIGNLIASAGGKSIKPEGTLAKLHQALQPSLSEMFFTSHLILVEGLEDFAYVTTYLTLMDLWNDFRRFGCHIVPVNGKSNFPQPMALAKLLDIPTYIIFDADTDKIPDPSSEKYKSIKGYHEKDNLTILKLWGISNPDPFPTSTFWSNRITMWSSDIGKTIEADIGQSTLSTYSTKADAIYGSPGGLEKNNLHIAAYLKFAWDDSVRWYPPFGQFCANLS